MIYCSVLPPSWPIETQTAGEGSKWEEGLLNKMKTAAARAWNDGKSKKIKNVEFDLPSIGTDRLDALRFAREAAWWQNEINGMGIVDEKFQFTSIKSS